MNRRPAHSWERQPEESSPAWHAFVAYRDMGGARSLAKVAEKLGKSATLMSRWSAEHAWVLRASAYDSDQDREIQAELRSRRREAARKSVMLGNAMKVVVGNEVAKLAQSGQNIRPQDLARFAEAAMRIEQSGFDLFKAPAQSAGVAGEGLEDVDLEELTDEEIRSHLLTLRRQIDADLADYPDLDSALLEAEDEDDLCAEITEN
jgi:hypothetical protein